MQSLRLIGVIAALFLVAEALAQPAPRPRPAPAPAVPPVAAPLAAPATMVTVPAPPAAEAQPDLLPAGPTPVAPVARSPCAELDHSDWGDNERWAWQRLCAGEVADFNRREAADAPRRNPREPGVWDTARLLQPRFLPTVLYSEPYRSLLPQAGARIAGAWLAEPVDLKGGLALAPLALEFCRIDGALDFADARFEAYLSLAGSVLARPVALARTRVRGQLLLSDTSVAGGIALGGARLGELAFEATTIAGALDLAGAEIAGRLLLRATRVDGALSLEGARIGGSALFERATLADAVNLANLEVAHDLLLLGGTRINGRLTLRGTRVRGLLDATEAAFGGPLATEALEVGGSFLLRRASFSQRAEIAAANVGLHLDLSGARLAGLDLSDTRVAGELRFGTDGDATHWGDGARLSLTRTQAEAFAGPFEVEAGGEVAAAGAPGRRAQWPPPGGVDLAGFAYRRLAAPEPGAPAPTVASRLDWLELDAVYSPQPYQQLASVLRAAGAEGDARAVLYAGRERARAEAWRRGELGAFAALSVLKATVGYGLGARVLRALAWVVALTALGALVLWRAPQTRPRGIRWGLGASFDALLPLIELDRAHGEAIARDLGRYGRAYFTLHQLLGWALLALVLAAFAGLTQG